MSGPPTHILDLILDLPLWRIQDCRSQIQKDLAHGPEPYYILSALQVPDDVIKQVLKNLPKTAREFFGMSVEQRLEWAQKSAPTEYQVELTIKLEYAVRAFVGRAVENYWVEFGSRSTRE